MSEVPLHFSARHSADHRAGSCSHRFTYHTVDCDPFVKSQLVSVQSTLGPFGVQSWSRSPQIWRQRNVRGPPCRSILFRIASVEIIPATNPEFKPPNEQDGSNATSESETQSIRRRNYRFRTKREQLTNRRYGILPGSQDQNLTSTVFYVQYSLDSGI